MNLQSKLDELKENFMKMVPDDVKIILERNQQTLYESGLVETVRKEGVSFPVQTLVDSKGKHRKLGEGATVISFFRGFWWPYCVAELDALNEVVTEIKAKGAELIVISPQLPEHSEKLIEDNGLDYPILYDKDNQLAKTLNLKHGFSEELEAVYKGFGIDVGKSNGSEVWNLPMPARFILNAEGEIIHGEVNPDYTQRPEPSEIALLLN